MVDLILVAFLTLLAIALLPIWPYCRAWGDYPLRAVALVLVIVLVLAVVRRVL